MFSRQNSDNQGLLKSVLMAYAVLVLHVLLIAGLGVLVLFFRGIVQYMIWIFLIGAGGLVISGLLFYRRMKAEGKTLKEMLHSPTFSGRSLEISILGGLASFRMGLPSGSQQLPDPTAETARQLEDPESFRKKELDTLLRLLNQNLISPEEYQKAKKEITQS